MSKPFVLPAAIVVAALPATVLAQTYPPPITFPPSPPAPPPIYAPPAPPAPPRPWTGSYDGGPRGNPGSWFTDDDYPADAKRAGEQGRVAILLSIDTAGRVVGCRVTLSSGSPSLDAATCRLAQRRGRFLQKTDGDGKPLEYTWPISTRWVLTDPDSLNFDLDGATVDLARGPFSRSLSVIIVDIDEEGVGVSCRSGTPNETTEDACSDFTVGRQMMEPVLRNGKPVGATITLTRSVRIQPTAPVAPPGPAPRRK